MNKKTGDIFGWILGFIIVFGGTFLVVSVDPLLYTFIALMGLFALSFPVVGVIGLVQETANFSDKYTNLPRLSTIKPLKKKVFFSMFGLLLSFAVLLALEVISYFYLKIIGIIYLAWVFIIFMGWAIRGKRK